MYRLKLLLINLLICAGVGFLMQSAWALISGDWGSFNYESLRDMSIISGLVGTVCMFIVFSVTLSVKATKAAVIGINMAICLALTLLIYVVTGISWNIWSLDLKWLIILIVSQTTTFLLTRHWYNKIQFYNRQLDEKKKSLITAGTRDKSIDK
jgi:hypothetical protein